MTMPSGFKPASTEELSLEVGQSVMGEYIGLRRAEFDGRNAVQYKIRRDDGSVCGLWANFDLEGSMENVTIGSRVYIERLQDDEPKKRGFSGAKRFSVGVMAKAKDKDISF